MSFSLKKHCCSDKHICSGVALFGTTFVSIFICKLINTIVFAVLIPTRISHRQDARALSSVTLFTLLNNPLTLNTIYNSKLLTLKHVSLESVNVKPCVMVIINIIMNKLRQMFTSEFGLLIMSIQS